MSASLGYQWHLNDQRIRAESRKAAKRGIERERLKQLNYNVKVVAQQPIRTAEREKAKKERIAEHKGRVQKNQRKLSDLSGFSRCVYECWHRWVRDCQNGGSAKGEEKVLRVLTQDHCCCCECLDVCCMTVALKSDADTLDKPIYCRVAMYACWILMALSIAVYLVAAISTIVMIVLCGLYLSDKVKYSHWFMDQALANVYLGASIVVCIQWVYVTVVRIVEVALVGRTLWALGLFALIHVLVCGPVLILSWIFFALQFGDVGSRGSWVRTAAIGVEVLTIVVNVVFFCGRVCCTYFWYFKIHVPI